MKPLADRIAALIPKWANRLSISDYKFRFNLVKGRVLNGDYASVDTDEHTREVTVDFNQDRLKKEPGEVERTVVHELLHSRFNEYADLVVDLLNAHVSNPKTKRMLLTKFEKLEHKIVVAITDALVKETKKHGTIQH